METHCKLSDWTARRRQLQQFANETVFIHIQTRDEVKLGPLINQNPDRLDKNLAHRRLLVTTNAVVPYNPNIDYAALAEARKRQLLLFGLLEKAVQKESEEEFSLCWDEFRSLCQDMALYLKQGNHAAFELLKNYEGGLVREKSKQKNWYVQWVHYQTTTLGKGKKQARAELLLLIRDIVHHKKLPRIIFSLEDYTAMLKGEDPTSGLLSGLFSKMTAEEFETTCTFPQYRISELPPLSRNAYEVTVQALSSQCEDENFAF